MEFLIQPIGTPGWLCVVPRVGHQIRSIVDTAFVVLSERQFSSAPSASVDYAGRGLANPHEVVGQTIATPVVADYAGRSCHGVVRLYGHILIHSYDGSEDIFFG